LSFLIIKMHWVEIIKNETMKLYYHQTNFYFSPVSKEDRIVVEDLEISEMRKLVDKCFNETSILTGENCFGYDFELEANLTYIVRPCLNPPPSESYNLAT
ncbi:hypothetical protein ACQP3F_26360, partial [Escherichia coli]